MIPIVPALIPKSASEVREVLPLLQFSPEVHLDVVDGQFVPFSSWPYQPKGVPAEVRAVTDGFTLEVDLMVADPLPAAKEWEAAGADILVFHLETITLTDWQEYCRTSKLSLSISALNDTSLDALLEYAKTAEAIQLMGIKDIGVQGQPFDRRVLNRIEVMKKHFPQLPITVDGSVNKNTLRELVAAGVDRVICGSALVKAPDPAVAYAELRVLLN